MNSLELFLNTLLWEKAPRLPENFRKFLFKVAPWSAIILAISGVLGILILVGFFGAGASFVVGLAPLIGSQAASGFFADVGPGFIFGIVLLAVETLLYFFAIPGLLAKKHAGWRWLFYALLASAVYELFLADFFSILFVVLELYFLFQIRDFYVGVLETQEEPFLPPTPPGSQEIGQQ